MAKVERRTPVIDREMFELLKNIRSETIQVLRYHSFKEYNFGEVVIYRYKDGIQTEGSLRTVLKLRDLGLLDERSRWLEDGEMTMYFIRRGTDKFINKLMLRDEYNTKEGIKHSA